MLIVNSYVRAAAKRCSLRVKPGMTFRFSSSVLWSLCARLQGASVARFMSLSW